MDTARGRATTIVIIEWILLVVVAILVFGAISLYYSESQKTETLSWQNNQINEAHTEAKILMIALAVGVFIQLLLNILLSFAVYNENVTCCKVWYVISIAGIAFQVLDFLKTLLTLNILAIGIHGLILAYRIYSVKTIINFAKELSLNRESALGVIYTSAPAPAVNNTKNIPDYPRAC